MDALIRDRIASDDPWAPQMEALGALHLYADMGGALFLCPSGEILGTVHGHEGVEVVSEDSLWGRLARVIASELAPELASLRPVRPRHSEDCSPCKGMGALMGAWCGRCHGLGWLAH